jgi:hypothetical protein
MGKGTGWVRIKSLVNNNQNRLNHKRPAFFKGTATTRLVESQSGQTCLVGPLAAGLAATATFTLPAAENGLNFRFVYVGGAADAQDFVVSTGSDTNYFIGGILQHDIGGDDGVSYHPDNGSNSKVTIETPDAGTELRVWCDGTIWYIDGFVNTATDTGVVFADQ